MRLSIAVLTIVASSSLALAQDRPNYELAQRFSSSYVNQRTYSTRVTPNWIGETDRFWYSFEDRNGWRYELVDPKDGGTKVPLFDRDDLAAKLSVAVKQPIDAEQLRLSSAKMDDEGRVFTFIYKNHKFELELVSGDLTDKGEPSAEDKRNAAPSRNRGRFRGFTPPPDDDEDDDKPKSDTHRLFSPDHTAYVFAQGADLYFVEASEEVQKEIAAIVERRAAEKKAEEEADEKKDDSKKEVVEQKVEAKADEDGQDDAEGEKKKKKKDADKGDDDKDKEREIETVRTKYRGESPFPMETDERLLWANGTDEGAALRLSEDGEEDYSFAGRSGGRRPALEQGLEQGQATDFEYDDYAWDLEYDDPWAPADGDEDEDLGDKTRPSISWAPDSSAFYVMRGDSRGMQDLFLVNSIAEPRPALETYSYSMPGEEKVRHSELYIFDRAKKALTQVESKWKDEQYRNMRWSDEDNEQEGPAELRFLRQDRLVRNLEYISLAPATGKSKVLLEEGFEAANVSPQGARYMEERDEFVWWSDRTGWGHLYLYDGEGKLKNAITHGKWRVSRIIDVDEEKGLLFFRGNGREDDQNIYYEHLYRVYLDGSGLACMDPGNASHSSVLSPTKSYLVDNCSRIDMAPVSYLYDAEGKSLFNGEPLEQMDLSRLDEAGWQMPETFTVMAADGVTPLYGNLWKPFDYDPSKQYPIIAEVYPGPQTEGVSHTFSSANGRQQLAQVGFFVIQVGHRGGTPGRSKAYHSYGYYNLRDYALEDKKVAIEQLAERYPIDLERIGLYGHSGGGFMTAAALMVPPYNDFFKVGVSSAGNHDNNIYNNYWSERYHGLKEVEVEDKKDGGEGRGQGRRSARPQDVVKVDVKKKGGKSKGEEKKKETRFDIRIPTNQELAANLKGNLLLVHGEIDNNVHPANTMRLVDALIKANKRFDLLIIPGARHGFGAANSYFNQRRWEFFAEHLLGDHQTGADILDKEVEQE